MENLLFAPRPSRRAFLKGAGAMGAAASFAAVLSACAPKAKKDDKPEGGSSEAPTSAGNDNADGKITAGISYELGTNGFDPMTTTAALTLAANWHTMEGLFEIETDNPAAAYKALAAGDLNKVDDTHFEATLRDGAVFHNGDAVTAEDVVFSFERVMNPDNKSLYKAFIPMIEKVEAKDEKTVVFTLKYAFEALLPNRLSVVKIVPKKVVEADVKAFDANPIGTGAYKMTANGADGTLKFERNDAYTGDRPARAKEMEWQILSDSDARTNALTSDTVQAIDSIDYGKIADVKSAGYSVESIQGFGLAFAMFNVAEGSPFNDLRNRQAVMYALDVPKAIEVGLASQASPATSFVQESHPSYKRASVVYERDLDKAKSLFAETGLTKMRLLATDHGWLKEVENVLLDSLKESGVEVEFTQKKSSDVYNTIDGNPDVWDVVIAPGDPSVFGADADLLMSWWYVGDVWTDTRMGWKGQDSYNKFQELIQRAAGETGDTQAKTWGECFDLISEEIPLYPLFHRKTPSAWSADTLVDFKPIALTGLSFVNVGTTK